MNKKFIAALAVVLIATSAVVIARSRATENTVKENSTEIMFIEQNWQEALSKAAKENKLVFLDVWATWCGPCRMLKKNTFTDKAVADFFNKNFVNASIDIDKSNGNEIASQYGIKALPTLIVADAKGKVILFSTGYMEAKELLQFGADALKRSQK